MTKPTTQYSTPAKPITGYGAVAKPTTPYGAATKPATSYETNPGAEEGVRLDSMTVTLDSLTVHLHGFTSDSPPPVNNMPTTPYGNVAKPITGYQ